MTPDFPAPSTLYRFFVSYGETDCKIGRAHV